VSGGWITARLRPTVRVETAVHNTNVGAPLARAHRLHFTRPRYHPTHWSSVSLSASRDNRHTHTPTQTKRSMIVIVRLHHRIDTASLRRSVVSLSKHPPPHCCQSRARTHSNDIVNLYVLHGPRIAHKPGTATKVVYCCCCHWNKRLFINSLVDCYFSVEPTADHHLVHFIVALSYARACQTRPKSVS